MLPAVLSSSPRLGSLRLYLVAGPVGAHVHVSGNTSKFYHICIVSTLITGRWPLKRVWRVTFLAFTSHSHLQTACMTNSTLCGTSISTLSHCSDWDPGHLLHTTRRTGRQLHNGHLLAYEINEFRPLIVHECSRIPDNGPQPWYLRCQLLKLALFLRQPWGIPKLYRSLWNGNLPVPYTAETEKVPVNFTAIFYSVLELETGATSKVASVFSSCITKIISCFLSSLSCPSVCLVPQDGK